MALRALVFDVDGTLAETEELHRQSFNQTFAEHGLDWVWDHSLYTELLGTTGGRERIVSYAKRVRQNVDADLLHARKTEIYNLKLKQGLISLRPGVVELIEHATNEGLMLAIGTTTSKANVVSLLHETLGPGSLDLFSSIRTGEDVRAKKPDPEVYRLVLSDLGLEGSECLCIEDSRNGLMAARGVGMRTVITASLFTSHEDFSGADLILRNLATPWSSAEFNPYTSMLNQPLEVSRLLRRAGRSGGRRTDA
ncbi:HAD-IA family hydrolase [Mesorhizobium sp. BH1-1-4]|uniref:HAD-IA family hydrolase n=1 Tax=Mesorhizobium sp. BH1-1-4 TaxID=2876662 RepID=UPI001CD0A9D2|nr:HAD-IA family hydrolase [Mesorhizobium sp. BH1-1-4]MBZ9993946.1 HAD-IA family hydrolase [Mesorhizobium sp. BH1-1-4]